MFYEFQEIRHIDDILKAVEGMNEIGVNEKPGGYTIVAYNVSFPQTFEIDENDDRLGSLRRECRGLAFDTETGKLISRPLHKFFNANERLETLLENVDFGSPHIIMEKLDGSMVRPLPLADGIRLATKRGCTDTSNEAERWLVEQDNWKAKDEWLRLCTDKEWTPVFEWISPRNRIVVDYGYEDLILIAVRVNLTGEYLRLSEVPEIADAPFNKVPVFESEIKKDINAYIDRVRADTGREGDVVAFHNGHRLKLKTEEYVRMHRAVEKTATGRRLISLVLNGELDDTLPLLDEVSRAEAVQYADGFNKAFEAKLNEIVDQLEIAGDKSRYPDRKSVALQFMDEHGIHAMNKKYIFGLYESCNELDRGQLRAKLKEMLLGDFDYHINETKRWEKCAAWLGIDPEKPGAKHAG